LSSQLPPFLSNTTYSSASSQASSLARSIFNLTPPPLPLVLIEYFRTAGSRGGAVQRAGTACTDLVISDESPMKTLDGNFIHLQRNKILGKYLERNLRIKGNKIVIIYIVCGNQTLYIYFVKCYDLHKSYTVFRKFCLS